MDDAKNPETSRVIASNQICLEEIFVQAHHIYTPEHTMPPDELEDLRQNIIPLLSRSMHELGYSLIKSNV